MTGAAAANELPTSIGRKILLTTSSPLFIVFFPVTEAFLPFWNCPLEMRATCLHTNVRLLDSARQRKLNSPQTGDSILAYRWPAAFLAEVKLNV
jgi:hypothetical protein